MSILKLIADYKANPSWGHYGVDSWPQYREWLILEVMLEPEYYI